MPHSPAKTRCPQSDLRSSDGRAAREQAPRRIRLDVRTQIGRITAHCWSKTGCRCNSSPARRKTSTRMYPAIAAAGLKVDAHRAVIDGEIVVLDVVAHELGQQQPDLHHRAY